MDFQDKLDLQGRLDRHPPAELLVEISQADLNGTLRIENDSQKIVIYFDGGELVYAASNARQHKLFEILISEKIITQQQLAEVKDFVNDLKLKENLIKRGLLSETAVKHIFARQFFLILQEAVLWKEGKWSFSPLVRIREEMRQPFDFYKMLFEFGRNLSGAQSVERLKSFREMFRVRQEHPNIDLQPEEAFVLSRFEDKSLTIENIRDLSGLSETETFRILYGLWLGGFLIRKNWNAAFSAEKLKTINSAKLQIKPPEVVPDKPEEKIVATPQPEKEVEKQETAEEVKKEFTLEDYLEQIEEAENHYETLDILQTASIAEIKKAYFSYAKRFHPDLFYRQVEADRHKQIQQAFTSIAQAYDALRNDETREVYDYKMRKNFNLKSKKPKAEVSSPVDEIEETQNRAAEMFEQGFTLLMNESFEQALPYLARAVNLVGNNAKYRAYYGRALAANNKNHQAEAELQTAIKLDAKNLDYRLMLARLFIEIGLVKRAEGELKRLLDIVPNNYEAQTLLDSL